MHHTSSEYSSAWISYHICGLWTLLNVVSSIYHWVFLVDYCHRYWAGTEKSIDLFFSSTSLSNASYNNSKPNTFGSGLVWHNDGAGGIGRGGGSRYVVGLYLCRSVWFLAWDQTIPIYHPTVGWYLTRDGRVWLNISRIMTWGGRLVSVSESS